MAVNPDRDDDLVRRYREASAEADERPAASARASILAAAAREVGAGPVPADAAKYRRSRRRWPLAAAAAVMLSTLAVMLAIRTDEQMPQFSAPPEPPRSTVEEVAPAAPAIDQAAPENRQSTVRSEPPAARARREGNGVADAPRETKRAMPAPAAPANAPVGASAPPPPKASAQSKPRTDEAEVRAMDQAGSDARRDAARGAAPAPSATTQSERSEADESAAAWLERIIKLRRAGQHEAADIELKRFRERYPQIQAPLEALPATGTR